MPAEPAEGGALLEADGLDVLYGDYQILWGARIRVEPGEVVALLGPNGAGKSTLMNTLSGLMRPHRGRVTFRGHRIERLPPHRIVGLGLSHVLERRRLFPYLTVGQNVLLGAYPPGARARRSTTRAEVEALFPLLHARWGQPAHTLSGGEQQMVAIARGLMACPTLLMIDEPFLGLAPQVVAQLSQVITRESCATTWGAALPGDHLGELRDHLGGQPQEGQLSQVITRLNRERGLTIVITWE